MNAAQTPKSMIRNKLGRVALAAALLSMLCSTVALGEDDPAKRRKEFYDNLQIMGEVYERVINNYVDEREPKEIMEAAIRGMLDGL
ncbi:MAG: C-terminal processing protease CtpA/Prc, partial [Candidatus Krumholzibacteriia bacterium]